MPGVVRLNAIEKETRIHRGCKIILHPDLYFNELNFVIVTLGGGTGLYEITLEAKEELFFIKRTRYMLCVGELHSDDVLHESKNYPCLCNIWLTLE